MKSAIAIAASLKKTLTEWCKEDSFCLNRGQDKEVRVSYLIWMTEEILANPGWEPDKAHRWIGYIQGVMVARGITTVEMEKDRVRAISSKGFNKGYTGIE